ncbi:hypothetical protein PAMP_018494 [Pampus punctatissimus]
MGEKASAKERKEGERIEGRCSRENCKYLHPPPHLKTQLEINGRNNLIQQKNMAMLAQQMQLANAMMPGTQLQPVRESKESKGGGRQADREGHNRRRKGRLRERPKEINGQSDDRDSRDSLQILRLGPRSGTSLSFCMRPQPMFSVTPSLATNANAAAAAAAAFNPYLGPVSPGLMPADILPSAPVLVTSNPSVPVPAAAAAAAQKLMRTDRLEPHSLDSHSLIPISLSFTPYSSTTLTFSSPLPCFLPPLPGSPTSA